MYLKFSGCKLGDTYFNFTMREVMSASLWLNKFLGYLPQNDRTSHMIFGNSWKTFSFGDFTTFYFCKSSLFTVRELNLYIIWCGTWFRFQPVVFLAPTKSSEKKYPPTKRPFKTPHESWRLFWSRYTYPWKLTAGSTENNGSSPSSGNLSGTSTKKAPFSGWSRSSSFLGGGLPCAVGRANEPGMFMYVSTKWGAKEP